MEYTYKNQEDQDQEDQDLIPDRRSVNVHTQRSVWSYIYEVKVFLYIFASVQLLCFMEVHTWATSLHVLVHVCESVIARFVNWMKAGPQLYLLLSFMVWLWATTSMNMDPYLSNLWSSGDAFYFTNPKLPTFS